MKKILVLYYVPKSTFKYSNWHDGFTKALDILEEKYSIDRYNIADHEDRSLPLFDKYQFILAKSNWGWIVDKYVKEHCAKLKIPKGIMISGSAKPSFLRNPQKKYDVLYYETEWYKKYLSSRKTRIHAFGIDTDIMNGISADQKSIDWLSIGVLKKYKRMESLFDKSGKKVIIGFDPKTPYSEQLKKQMIDNEVEFIPFMSYSELSYYYAKTKNLLANGITQGGGERAVLEARAYGCNIHINPDNLKLKEMAECPIYDHHYYASQMQKGIEEVC